MSPLAFRADAGAEGRKVDVLLRALVEAEIDGVAVANQLTALKETIDSLAKVIRHWSARLRTQLVRQMMNKCRMDDHISLFLITFFLGQAAI